MYSSPRRFIAICDAVGVAGLLATLVSTFPEYFKLTDHWKGVWSNAGFGILCSWISVRILDGIIADRDQAKDSRSRMLENMRECVQYTRRFLYRIEKVELDNAVSRTRYINHAFLSWRTSLDRSELDDCTKVYGKFGEILNLAKGAFNKQKTAHELYKSTLRQIDTSVYSAPPIADASGGDVKRLFSLQSAVRDAWEMVVADLVVGQELVEAVELRRNSIAAEVFSSRSDLSELVDGFFSGALDYAKAKSEISRNHAEFEDLVRAAEQRIRDKTPEK